MKGDDQRCWETNETETRERRRKKEETEEGLKRFTFGVSLILGVLFRLFPRSECLTVLLFSFVLISASDQESDLKSSLSMFPRLDFVLSPRLRSEIEKRLCSIPLIEDQESNRCLLLPLS